MSTTFSTSRLFPASTAAVFAAFSDPQRLARWWGPNGFTNRFEIFECTDGGNWQFTMHAPDGKVFPNLCRIAVIEPGRRIVIEHLNAPPFQLDIRLEPHGDSTMVRWDQTFDDDQLAAALRAMVEPANEQNLDRWSAEVRQTRP